MDRFITLLEVRTRTLNGNTAEYLSPLAVNVDRITHIFPSGDRCTIYVDGDGDGRLIDMGFDALVDELNDKPLE